VTDPRPHDRSSAPGCSFGWVIPAALTALVIVLAWRLWETTKHDVHDPNAETRPVTPRGDLAQDEKSTIGLFEAASPAVVHVTNLARGLDWTGNELEVPQGTGSGFVWDAKGYVVTNYHVVAGANAVAVALPDRTTLEAEVVGHDEFHDLAVLKVDAKGRTLPALRIGSSRNLLVGQKVFAIGNPFGLDQTLTTGIISGLGREILSQLGTPIQGVIQTDAAINPGNSGGPLLDSTGLLIGMNTQIASPSGASAGVGFAIPVDTINRVVPQIIRTGVFQRAGLGIVMVPDLSVAQARLRGVMFYQLVPGGAAASAGLRPTQLVAGRIPMISQAGDAIVAIDGQKVEGRSDLFRVLDGHEVGQEVELTYLRDGREEKAKVTLVAVDSK
jgi:S1-C subfamily serine protease